ncbi:MAG: FtsX-like permease family protein, partial [Blastocatellia bacterium]
LGGALGLFLAWAGVSALTAAMPESLALVKTVTIDLTVLTFTLVASALTGVFFGLFPAFQATRLNLNEALKEGGRDGARGRSGMRSLLVVVEVALALALMAGAGLMINSFLRLRQVDAGFKPGRLLTMEIDPTLARHPNHAALAAFYDQLLERIAALPGVESAGVVTRLPLTDARGHYMFRTESQAGWKYAGALPSTISPGYFHTMGIPLLSGRAFTPQDVAQSAPVAVINEAMRERAWPNQDPLGKRIRMYPYDATALTLTVIGVVKDVRQSELQATARPEVYRSYAQMASYSPRDLVIRTSVAPLGLAPAVRDAIQSVDKDQPVSNVRTMERILADSIADERFNMLLLAIYAALALMLAAVGIYGVMSYLVTQNTREIGIRLALGAQARDVLRLVAGQGLALTIAGIVVGLIGAWGLTRLMKKLLYGVTATDPLTFICVSLLLIFIALLACYIPARRATKVDPIIALRCN